MRWIGRRGGLAVLPASDAAAEGRVAPPGASRTATFTIAVPAAGRGVSVGISVGEAIAIHIGAAGRAGQDLASVVDVVRVRTREGERQERKGGKPTREHRASHFGPLSQVHLNS